MRARLLSCLALVVAISFSLAAPASAVTTADPEASILVDADTGNVISAVNERAALPPASITKLLTALTVLSRMKPTDTITVASPLAESMPALKVGVKQGETWTVDRLLHALLMVSANDAAVALAEGSTGSLDNFVIARTQAAKDLGLTDAPRFNDPAGLDDAEWGHDGGDQVSARDMAIIARAALANDEIRSIVSSQRYDFTGLDGYPHHFLNHDGMLKTYAGSLGMKTGYTKKAGHTLVAAAQRDGRTMIAVIMNSKNPNAIAAQMLDQGFATPVASESTAGQLVPSSVKPVVAIAAPDPGIHPAANTNGGAHRGYLALAAAFVAVLLAYLVHHIRSTEFVVRRRRRPIIQVDR